MTKKEQARSRAALKAWATMRSRWAAALGFDAAPIEDDSFDVKELERAPFAAYFSPVEGEPGFEEYRDRREREEASLLGRLIGPTVIGIRTRGAKRRRRWQARGHSKPRWARAVAR